MKLVRRVLLGTALGAAAAFLFVRTDPNYHDMDPGQRTEDLAGSMILFVPLGGSLGFLLWLRKRYRIVRRA